MDEFLAEPGHLLRIATVDADGMPRNVPIWYILHDNRIVFTPRDRSVFLANVLRDPRVGLTIDEETAPYRKVTIQGRAELLHPLGEDDAWRDLYREIAARYIPRREADAYVDATINEPRALLGVSLDPGQSKITTWRMPVRGEDPAGIWHRRYYHDYAATAEHMPDVVPLLLGWMSNDAGVMVTGGSGVMRYPIPGYAVVHERGIVLFDTGLHDTLMDSTAELRGLAKVFKVELTRDDLVETRLAAHGIDAEAITHIVNSHLHFDHCGRNGPFAHATTLLQADEWEAAHHPGPTTYVGVHLDEIEAGHVELLRGAHDVFGDGTVVCVPTPGHTAGHQSLLVREADRPGADVALLVGDACYLQRMLADGVPPPFADDAERQRHTYRVLAQYQAEGTRLLFSHDVDHWDVVPDGLAGGT